MPSFVHKLSTQKTAAAGADFVVASLTLPPGDYIVSAKTELQALGTSPARRICLVKLVVGDIEDSALRTIHGHDEPDDIHQIHLVVGATLTAPTEVKLLANDAGTPGKAVFVGVVITAELIQNLVITEAVGDPPPPEEDDS